MSTLPPRTPRTVLPLAESAAADWLQEACRRHAARRALRDAWPELFGHLSDDDLLRVADSDMAAHRDWWVLYGDGIPAELGSRSLLYGQRPWYRPTCPMNA